MASQNSFTVFSDSQGDRIAARRVRRFWLVAVGIVLVFVLGAEIVLRRLIAPIPDTTAYVVHLVHSAAGTDVVAGDSQIKDAFLYSNSSFVSLARGGLSIPQISYALRAFYRYRPAGRLVLEAAPQMLVPSQDATDFSTFFTYYGPFPTPYVFEKGISRSLVELRRPGHLLRQLQLDKSEREAEAIAAQSGTQVDTGVKNKKDVKSIADQIHASEWLRKRVAYQRPPWGKSSEKLLEQYDGILAEMIGKGVEICMLRTPVNEAYAAMTKEDQSFQKAEKAFRMLAQKYGVPYVRYDSLPMTFDSGLFKNADHLTAAAGRLFAPLVIRACFSKTD